ncbi:hypothetical protein PM10SUCC1_07310 [Propionigenium maris DSM 9537]|uniref:Uncharacterized protein n=1 Tax=Propionigenium maris DSM 9537 TaxID=1123000 RepID=A0A9W6LLE1_9FUSO|nr:hypothetical protein [Propionigenium maris]GLI55216.1 hypothetical protein PM10SUCC1_07310 [Propionigenium maris DSM 9537]
MNTFTVNRYKEEIEISEESITFHLRRCRLTKRLEELKEIRKTITYGGLLFHLFGARAIGEPKLYSIGYRDISLEFKFKENDFCLVEFSVGDEPMVERSLKNIDDINILCSSFNKNIELTSEDKRSFF